ncbi:lipid II:glycine glycyltransferase FemX [Rothia nasimurium]|uniref:lipid II:glycine glycyltransferase FemX n=1 Tax=Rothia nasimurium TaxID=85336 RepID=UPI001F01AE5E|nr:peptidoglycan bridge formation glycyltransferase FemA/FemB family protein [Rothia nasimurium]
MSNILQSDIWARFQEANGHQVFRGEGQGWRYMATLEGGATGRYLYAPYGPEADSAAAFDAAIADLKRVAAENKCWFIRVEPTDSRIWGSQSGEAFLAARGFTLSPRQVQPSHTQIIDLTQSEEDILADMKSTNRNLHRNIHKKGVTFEKSQNPADISILLKYLDETAGRAGFNRQQDAYLTRVAEVLMPADAATLFIARVDGEPIGASLVYDSDDTRVYAHAATSFEHRKLQVGNPLLSTLILDAKAKGLTTMDLFGIAPDDDPNHEWAGFTKFKKSFGGESVTYPGTWDLPVSAAGYKAYQGIRSGREALASGKKFATGTLLPKVKDAVGQVRARIGK